MAGTGGGEEPIEISLFASEAIGSAKLREFSTQSLVVEMRTRVGDVIANGVSVFGDEVGCVGSSTNVQCSSPHA